MYEIFSWIYLQILKSSNIEILNLLTPASRAWEAAGPGGSVDGEVKTQVGKGGKVAFLSSAFWNWPQIPSFYKMACKAFKITKIMVIIVLSISRHPITIFQGLPWAMDGRDMRWYLGSLDNRLAIQWNIIFGRKGLILNCRTGLVCKKNFKKDNFQVDPKTLEIRRSLAQKLREEVVGHDWNFNTFVSLLSK